MTDSKINQTVNWYFRKNKKWKTEIETLRNIVLKTALNEELKWGCPCYTYQKSNIVLIHVFKEYCALLFFKGSLMNDESKILIQQTKNVQAARQMRFTELVQIQELEPIIKTYIQQAIQIEKSGIKVELKKSTEFSIPPEFQEKLDSNQTLNKAFTALTPGRQRAYLLYFSAAKQSKTRTARIEKYEPQILLGKGIDD